MQLPDGATSSPGLLPLGSPAVEPIGMRHVEVIAPDRSLSASAELAERKQLAWVTIQSHLFQA